MLPPPPHLLPLPAPLTTGDGARVLPGVPFAALPGARPLELDLHLPDGPRPHPVVVFLHGGGWRAGSRHAVGPAYAGASPTPFERLAAAGIATASVDYRLSGEALWPAQLHDAEAAVRWLRARGPEAGLDPGRVAAWGESAGAHLAALLGLTGGGSSAVDAVVTWYAPTDLPAIAAVLGTDPAAADSREALLLGAPLTAVPEAAAQASPVTHVSGSAPPFLLLHGEADRLVPADQSHRLHDALRAVGAEAELVTYPGADHLWHGSPDAAANALDRTVSFLARVLEAPGLTG